MAAVLFALTLPGLVIGLVGFALVARLTGRGGAAATGLDVLGTALAPGRQHLADERNRVELTRGEESDGAPPRTRVDLDRGTATVRLPRG